jgi:hypothetical protein
MLPDSAVKAIQDSVVPSVIEIGGEKYISRNIALPPAEPIADNLDVHTLTGLADYVRQVSEGDHANLACVHVLSPTQVEVLGKIEGRHQKRPTYVTAKMLSGGFNFKYNQYLSAEDFIIGLQACFVSSETRAKVLQIVGNLREESVKTVADDGVSQIVTATNKAGFAENAVMPNSIELAPYRTFPEIQQPTTPFVLRVQRSGKEGELPKVGLFETGDATWQLEAIKQIKAFLADKVKGVPVIA